MARRWTVTPRPGRRCSSRATAWTRPMPNGPARVARSARRDLCRMSSAFVGTAVGMRAWARMSKSIPDWEIDSEPESATAEAPRPSHLQVWLGLLPRWSWVIIASVFVLIVESVVARFVTPADSWIRTTWSLSQLAIGLLAAFGCHIFNFLVLAADDAEIGLLDLLMKPLKLWGRAIRESADAAVGRQCGGKRPRGGCAFRAGHRRHPLRSALGLGLQGTAEAGPHGRGHGSGARSSRRKREEDLEKSINDFAGKNGDESTDKPKTEPPKPKQNADCVILGYRARSRWAARVAGAGDGRAAGNWCMRGTCRRSCRTTK